MTTEPPRIEYYFSVNSPWSFLASDRLLAIGEKYGAAIDVMPIDLKTIFPQSGGLPLPKRAPQRQAYRLLELKRWGEFLGIPIALEPAHFPSPEDIAVRTVIAARHTRVDPMRLAREIGWSLWVDQKSIADWDLMANLITKLGGDASVTLGLAREDARQAEYEAFTSKAVAAGVFGAPSFVVAGELFWGQDRLDFVERAVAARASQ